MVVINEVSAREVFDSREEPTVEISMKTTSGNFVSSAPNGKSTGKNEVKSYKKNLKDDVSKINELKDYFSDDIIEEFEDLKRVEDILDRHVGGNTLFAFESCVLKALAKEKFGNPNASKKESNQKGKKNFDVWKLINPEAGKEKKFPRLVGNVVGGGKHSDISGRKPDFQEFELIPDEGNIKKNYEANKKAKEIIEMMLSEKDKNFKGRKNDENAWITSLNEREVLDVLREIGIPSGLDVAASSFYKRKKYLYNNPMLKRDSEEQFGYLSNLIKNFKLFYIEDPFDEEDFESHAKLLKKFPNSLIVGDDLTVTSSKRLKKAIEMKAVNALIVKPNQCGSLLEVKKVVELAKENNIKTVFSHRSGETDETILADLAFGFGADFFKCGTEGDVRVKKIKRLIEIEESLK